MNDRTRQRRRPGVLLLLWTAAFLSATQAAASCWDSHSWTSLGWAGPAWR